MYPVSTPHSPIIPFSRVLLMCFNLRERRVVGLRLQRSSTKEKKKTVPKKKVSLPKAKPTPKLDSSESAPPQKRRKFNRELDSSDDMSSDANFFSHTRTTTQPRSPSPLIGDSEGAKELKKWDEFL